MTDSLLRIFSTAVLGGLLLFALALAPDSVRGDDQAAFSSSVYGNSLCASSSNADQPIRVSVQNLADGQIVASTELWSSGEVECWSYPFPAGDWRVSFNQDPSGIHPAYSKSYEFKVYGSEPKTISDEAPYLGINGNEICPFSPNTETPIVVSIQDRARGDRVVASRNLGGNDNPPCWVYPFPVGLWRVVVHQEGTADYPAYNDSRKVTRAARIKTDFRGWVQKGSKLFVKIRSDAARAGQQATLYVVRRKAQCFVGSPSFCDTDSGPAVKRAIEVRVQSGVQRISIGRTPRLLTDITVKMRDQSFVKNHVPYFVRSIYARKSFGKTTIHGITFSPGW